MRSVWFEDGKVKLIDQTKLPTKVETISCSDVSAVVQAIKAMKVRGAPAIGVAAAFGMMLAARDKEDLNDAAKALKSARPTAVNLAWAVDLVLAEAKKTIKMKEDPTSYSSLQVSKVVYTIFRQQREICKKISENGAAIIKNGETILTHCNAGALACVDFGTALGVIIEAHRRGRKIQVYAGETRPLLQGARLTAFELAQAKVNFTLICDNMAGFLMKQGKVSRVIVGADRIASNGDTANKIGTYSLAVLANAHGVPFYVAAPLSTIDFSIESGDKIPIEERGPDEVTQFAGVRVAPDCKVYNPAFDVTPAGLITAVITEEGIFKPSELKGLKEKAEKQIVIPPLVPRTRKKPAEEDAAE